MTIGARLLRFAGLVADRDRALGDTPALDGGGALAAGFAAALLIPAGPIRRIGRAPAVVSAWPP